MIMVPCGATGLDLGQAACRLAALYSLKARLNDGLEHFFPHPQPFSRREKGGVPLPPGEESRLREDFQEIEKETSLSPRERDRG